MTSLDSLLKGRDITLLTKFCLVKVMVFPVVVYGCESWTIRKAEPTELILSNCGARETLECPLASKEIKAVNSKGNQSWIFTGRTDAEAEAPILWSSDVKSRLTGKYPDAGKDWRQEEKGTTEDEMVGWHHRLNRHEIEQALRDSEGQGSLVCGGPRGCKESDTTEWLTATQSWKEWNNAICSNMRATRDYHPE